MSLKLHLLPGSHRSTAVLITAIATKSNFTIVPENPVSCKTAEYKKLQPLGKIPVAETPEGPLYESNSICRYLARKSKSLYGANDYEQSQIDQWLDLIRMDLISGTRIGYSLFGFPETMFNYKTKNFETDLANHVHQLKTTAEAKLHGKHFLVGEHLSIADITLMADLEYFYKYIFTAKERNQLPNLTAYFERLSKLPEFKQVFGHIEFPTETWPLLVAKDSDKKDKKDDHKKDKKDDHKKEGKKDDHKKDEKKKEEKKKEEKKKVEVDDDEPIEEKPKTYDFPATTFDLFAFKTLYVNSPNKQDALDFLWKNWDGNAFSFYYLEYMKVGEDGKVLFLTNNLMNGYLSRADQCRKYSLAVHGVYGDEPNLEIRGVWMWKGTDILEPLKEHDQFDIYKYKKLDPTNEADKALITQYWTGLEEDVSVVEGRVARTVKYFK